MMKILAVMALGAALAGCSGGNAAGKTAMVDSCVKESQDKKMCSCMVDELEKGLDKETFAAITTAAAKGEELSPDYISKMKPEQMTSLMTATMTAGQKCEPA
jgi:hypothetical protein